MRRVPGPLTSLVGRRGELLTVRRLLAANRLLTLTGAGGVGKTRLALATANQVRRVMRDGVYFVDLSTLHDPALLAQTVATALGLSGQSGDPATQFVEYAENRAFLLILDNCEHLIDVCAELVDRLLVASASVRVLTTSRQVLGVTGEQIFSVPPLPVSDSAVALFIDRAAAALPGFAATAEQRTRIARICATLEGMPLAIELAAARVRTLTLREIEARLADSFRLLTGGDRTGPPHQQSLAATIEWSYRLCSAEEQLLWQRLSVFESGITLAAVREVCSGDGLAEERLVELLADLVDKSVLLPDLRHDESRFRLLDTLRRFGLEQLRQADGEPTIRRRHRDYYRRLAERCELEMDTDQPAVHERVKVELANFRSALEFCLNTPGEAHTGLDMTIMLFFCWQAFGGLEEAHYWFTRALAASPEPTVSRGMALWGTAIALSVQGDQRGARSYLTQSQHLARELADERLSAFVIFTEAFLEFTSGDLARSPGLFEVAARRLDATPIFRGVPIVYRACRVIGLAFLGDLESAMASAQEVSAMAECANEQWGRSYVHYATALVRWLRGDLDLALHSARHGIRMAYRFSDLTTLAVLIELLPWIKVAEGSCRSAAYLFGVVSCVWPLVGARAMFGSQNWIAPHEDAERRARGALGDDVFDAEFAAGAAVSEDLDHAVAAALGEPVDLTDEQDSIRLDLLTKRETEVVELIAKGLSNRAIAERLLIAQRTAEAHVNHILVKLGFTSRAQVAGWLADAREVDRVERK